MHYAVRACPTDEEGGCPFLGQACEAALCEAVELLLLGTGDEGGRASDAAGEVLRYLDGRMCIPRDMGAPAAATIRALAKEME